MIPSYPSPQNQLDLTQGMPEGQPMQIPKIDHIIAHAKHPEFSYIYARPELQASASSTIPQPSTPSQNDASTPKKGRPKKTTAEGSEKNPVTKVKKSQIYDKYYIDTTKPKKTAPIKKVDLWDKDAWHAILNRKKKYFEFCKLTGELTNWRSDDEEGEADDMSEDEEDLENLRRIPRDNYKEDFREHDDNENENENNDEHSKEGEMQVEDDNKDHELEQSESGQDHEERESIKSNENREEVVRDVQGNVAEVEHDTSAGVEQDEQKDNVEKMQVENENLEEKGDHNAEIQNNQENL